MYRYEFQDAFERFVGALDDAFLLLTEAEQVNDQRSKERGSGGRNPESQAMYRAIAVISVAAWEDFNEQLVSKGYDYFKETAVKPVPADLKEWFKVGELQSPNSYHIRKLYWAYFGLDPMPLWWFSYGTRARDIGIPADWWYSFNDDSHLEERTLRGAEAAKWLNSLVRLRHATAHYDLTHYERTPEIGVATANRGRWGVTMYTAQNAIASVTQLALCTLEALAGHLNVPGQLRYSAPLRSSRWQWLLEGRDYTLIDLPQWSGNGKVIDAADTTPLLGTPDSPSDEDEHLDANQTHGGR